MLTLLGKFELFAVEGKATDDLILCTLQVIIVWYRIVCTGSPFQNQIIKLTLTKESIIDSRELLEENKQSENISIFKSGGNSTGSKITNVF